MLNKLLAFLRRYEMLQPGDQLICAVSGGADSIAMLFAFYLLREKLQVSLAAAHFNHGLRGTESDRDEAFVRDFCEGYGIPLYTASQQVVAGPKGLEAAAREARYAFFSTLFGKIATAHTADDNAETVLMRMVRGTGLKGLGAIAPVSGSLIRPMLMITREDVLAFLDEYHIRYVEDSSNKTDAFLRNRLRHHVLPLLQAENPKFSVNLSATALRLREDEAELSQNNDSVNVQKLRVLSPAARSRRIGAFLERCGIKEPSSVHIMAVERLVFSDSPSASANLPGGRVVCRQYDTLLLREDSWQLPKIPIACPGDVTISELNLRVTCEMAKRGELCVQPKGEIYIRSRQSGDKIRLSGGTRTLKKLFIDRKIPAHKRDAVPVVADDLGVLWVHGIGPNLDRLSTDLSGVVISFKMDQSAEC